jgi:thiamine-phosphate pyrophosphorylase
MSLHALRQRLCLVTPRVGDTPLFIEGLQAALDSADVAAVLLRLQDADERALVNLVKNIARIVQRRDIALLLDGRPELVARAGADGAHITGVAAFTAARDALKPDRIAGAGGLDSRHDAMVASEAGADYVMFGDPPRPPFDTVLERLEWWAELFQPPCIGYAASADEVAALARAGADFIALGDWIWTHAEGPAAAVSAAAAHLAEPVR